MSALLLAALAVAVGGFVVVLWTRHQYQRGHLVTRASMRVALHTARAAWWTLVLAYDHRNGWTTGRARRIWRRGRLPASSDTTLGPKKPKRLPGRVLRAERVPAGLRLTVRLPGGWVGDDLDGLRVASGTRKSIDARVEAHPHGGPNVVRVTLIRHDTLRGVVDAPDPVAGVVAIGVAEDGQPVHLDLHTSNLAVGGQTRAGKSNLLHLVVASFAHDERADLVLLDGKHIELAAWRDRARSLIGADPAAALAAVKWVEQDMRRRYEHIGKHGKRKASDLATVDQPGPLLLLVDEITTYTDDPEHGKQIVATLLQIARQGLAADVHLVVATQKATGDSLPTTLRDLCETRVAFSCSTREMGEAILGRGQGALAAQLASGPDHRGRCVVSHPDGTIVYGRAYLASDAWLGRTSRSAASSAAPSVTAPAPAPRSGAGAAPRTRADDEQTARTSADTRPGAHAHANTQRPAGETRAQRRARNRAAHAERRSAWLADEAAADSPDNPAAPTRPALSVVGGVQRREEP